MTVHIFNLSKFKPTTRLYINLLSHFTILNMYCADIIHLLVKQYYRAYITSHNKCCPYVLEDIFSSPRKNISCDMIRVDFLLVILSFYDGLLNTLGARSRARSVA